jgi:nicotinamidase-related amidase
MKNLDARYTALLLIDLMERIVDQPLAPRSGRAVVETAKRLATTFRQVGAPVVVVRVERPNVVQQPPGSELVAGIAEVDDILIVKRSIGAFHGTDLHQQLQARGINSLVFTGIATNLGVESTARAAADHGYSVIFVEDAMAAFTHEEHHSALAHNFPRLGEVLGATDITLKKTSTLRG